MNSVLVSVVMALIMALYLIVPIAEAGYLGGGYGR